MIAHTKSMSEWVPGSRHAVRSYASDLIFSYFRAISRPEVVKSKQNETPHL